MLLAEQITSPSVAVDGTYLSVPVFVWVTDLQFAAEEDFADAAQFEAHVVVDGGRPARLAEAIHLSNAIERLERQIRGWH